MKTLIFFLTTALLFTACGETKGDLRSKVKDLEARNAELASTRDEMQGTITDYVEAVNEIEANLHTIKEAEDLIELELSDEELRLSAQERINRDLEMIYDLLGTNRQVIANLESKLENQGAESAQLKSLIASLNKQVAAREDRIEDLANDLLAANVQIDQLNLDLGAAIQSRDRYAEQSSQRQEIILAQDEKLHKAYFLYGSMRELKDLDVVEKEGGVLGVGSVPQLTSNFPSEHFVPLDTRKHKHFPVYAKKAELVTEHPAGSYELIKEDGIIKQLEVVNPEEFWKTSKYLVVVVQG